MVMINKGEGNDIPTEDDLEIGSIESFGTGDKKYSHQALIMKCMGKAIDCGCVEMTEGKPITKKLKTGDVLHLMSEDTRRKFIESIKTTKNFMSRDFDDEANKKIGALIKEIEFNKTYWHNKELEWWNGLKHDVRQSYIDSKQHVIAGMHNTSFPFLDQSLNDSLDIWRDVLEELNKLSKRLNDYESDRFEA